MIELNCPSCGGQLELPENLDIAHCMYCGTKILIQDKDKSNEQINLKRYKELSNTAFEAKNFEETIKYCNKVLEIDTKDIEAWINKAISTSKLSTVAHNRYEESVSYLDKANQLAPDDARILKAKKEVKHNQSTWLNDLGVDAIKHAHKIYKIQDVEAYARRESRDKYREAMKYFLDAWWFAPDDETILKNITTCAKSAHWISWSKAVTEKIDRRESLQAKQDAIKQLPRKRKELDNLQEELNKLESDKGFFIGLKIRETENRIRLHQNEINRLEKIVLISNELENRQFRCVVS